MTSRSVLLPQALGRLSRRAMLATLAAGAGAALAACSGAPSSTANPTTAPAAAGAASPTTSGGTAGTNTTPTTSAAPTTAKATPASGSTPTTAPAAAAAPSAAGPATINFYSGGDTNVHDLWANDLFPLYAKVKPDVKFNLVFAEHGNGDQTTFDRVAAAKKAGKPSGVDIWETGLLVQGGEAGLIEKLDTQKVPNLSKVPKDVFDQYEGYGLPYRGSSVVLAYNSKTVSSPPKTLDDLLSWIKSNDGQFTYNPPDTGGSGDAFVTRVLMTKIPQADLAFFQKQYDPKKESEWDAGWTILKDLGAHVYNHGFYPKGNVGVLQALGKGSINVAPVWSDMGLSYLSQKLLPSEIKLTQIDPPFYGGASYIGIVADSKTKQQDYDFFNWLLTPDAQTVVITKMNGYPGLDWKYMPADVKEKFADIAKAYSFGFSSKFDNDMHQQWYEKVAGTPPPPKKS